MIVNIYMCCFKTRKFSLKFNVEFAVDGDSCWSQSTSISSKSCIVTKGYKLVQF
jgi:hypothetical protein